MTWGLDRVTVEFGQLIALDDVSIQLERGAISLVVGGDGAGKTTLCRTLVGLDSVKHGEVSRPARVGFQPESSGVWGDLTVSENLSFVAGAYHLEPEHASERISELLEVTGLRDAESRLGRDLSGGMRQKLGVAMAVLSEPELLVLDEPTTGLDPISRLELWSFITLATQQGCAVLVTTTYLDEADHGVGILVLESGKPLAHGTTAEVIAAMPGSIYVSDRPHGANSWRRGSTWRVWSEDGTPIPDARRTEADLSDVVTAAALKGER